MLKLNGTTVKTPTETKLGRFIISKSERTADGTMQQEIIARKRRLDCSWELIRAADLKQIHDILESQTYHIVDFVDTRTGEAGTMEAYVGDMWQTLWQKINGVTYWRNVSIALIER